MRKLLIVCSLAGLLRLPAEATSWRPNDRLLQAVRHIESSNGRSVIGDNGESLGDFQMSEAAWLDVSVWRKQRGLRTYNYRQFAFNPKINRLYASDYLALMHARLKRDLKRPPGWGELYAAYNMGYKSFAECEFKLARVNPTTAAKCRQIKQMMQPRKPR